MSFFHRLVLPASLAAFTAASPALAGEPMQAFKAVKPGIPSQLSLGIGRTGGPLLPILGSDGMLTRDFRPYQSIYCNLVCDATITAPLQLAIPYYNNSVNPSNFTDAASNFVVNLASALTGGTPEHQVIQVGTLETFLLDNVFGQGTAEYLGSLYAAYYPYILWAQVVIAAAQMYAEAENVLYRTYDFYAPVAGDYTFTVGAKGGWDLPNNKVAAFSVEAGGGQVFAWHDSFGSDRDVPVTRHLAKGAYRILVGLGSGSSHQFHTAGSLKGILLRSPEESTWTMPVTVKSMALNLAATLPEIGSSAVLDVPFPGYPDPAPFLVGNPGGSIVFSNPRAVPVLQTDPSRTARAVNKAIHFYQAQITNTQAPYFDGTAGRFFVTRTEDLDWVDDPGYDGYGY